MKRMLSLFVICAAILLAVTPALAARIDSVEIMPADGVTGQDIQSGDGVKTGHIQDGAVTNAKIADAAITEAKLADGAVTDTKISGVISGGKIGSHAHNGSDVLDGSITESKIAGQISANKISSVGLDADTLDGVHTSDLAPVNHGHFQPDIVGLDVSLSGKADIQHTHTDLQPKYANVVVVAKSGGDFTDIIAAVNSISDSSEFNPYLIKVMPGIYDLANQPLVMKPYVDLEGSGQNITVVKGSVESDWSGNGGLVQLANNSGLRNLTINLYEQFLSSLGSAIGAMNVNTTISNVTISANSEYAKVFGLIAGTGSDISIHNSSFDIAANLPVGEMAAINLSDNARLTMNDSKIIGNAINDNCGVYGIMNGNKAFSNLNNVEITSLGRFSRAFTCMSSGGTSPTPIRSEANIRNSKLSAAFAAVCSKSGTIINIENSVAQGRTSITWGAALNLVNSKFITDSIASDVYSKTTCLNTYDENLEPVVCP